MKVIIAGSRSITKADIGAIVRASGFEITEVVCGKAPGIDTLGEQWARANGIHVEPFPAIWDDLSHPDAVIRYRRDGTPYDAKAGHRRNEKMAEYADALIAIPAAKGSPGTWDMVRRARAHGLPVYIYRMSNVPMEVTKQ
jgi:YspA, cpYpsA-related SLOG family